MSRLRWPNSRHSLSDVPGTVQSSVLFIIDQLGCGGAERQLVELACNLHRCGMRVTVFAYRPGDFFAGRLDTAGVQRIQLYRGGWRNVRFFRHLRSAMRRFDLVHSFGSGPSAWAALGRQTLPVCERPVLVASERSWGPSGHSSPLLPHRWIFRQADAVTVNNATARRRIARLLGVAESRVEQIDNGIDLPRWDAASQVPCPLPIQADHFNLAQIGGIRPEKNQLLSITALGRIPPAVRAGWRLWLVGDAGHHPNYYRRLTRAVDEDGLGGIVHFSPAVAHIAPVMTRLDGLLVPSLREGFPNAVLEAMSLGKPVVVSDVGAMPEMIGADGEEPCGLVVAAGEIEPLSEAIRTLAENPALRRRMGDRARARVAERYLSARVLPLLEEMWLEVGNLPGGTVKLTRRGRDDPSMARLSS